MAHTHPQLPLSEATVVVAQVSGLQREVQGQHQAERSPLHTARAISLNALAKSYLTFITSEAGHEALLTIGIRPPCVSEWDPNPYQHMHVSA